MPLRTSLVIRIAGIAIMLAISTDLSMGSGFTRIRGFVLNSSMELGEGSLLIEWNRFADQTGAITPLGFKSVEIKDGIFDVNLRPNKDVKPPGSAYRVTYRLKTGETYVENWVIPRGHSVLSVEKIRVVEDAPDPGTIAPRLRNMWRSRGWN